MADDVLQKHMQGFTQNLIEGKLEPKELGFNETTRKGVYKHLDGTTIDLYPSENALSKTVTPSGGSLVGIASAAFTVLSATNDQSLWAEVDAQLASVLAGLFIRIDGTVAFTGSQSLGGNSLTNVTKVGANTTTENIEIEAGNSGVLLLDASDDSIVRVEVSVSSIDGFEVGSAADKVFSINMGDKLIRIGNGSASNPHVAVSGRLAVENRSKGLTASTTQTQGQGQITNVISEITTVANVGDTVTLPDQNDYIFATEGQFIWVKNNGANRLQIFPFTSARIDGGTLNASINIDVGSGVLFYRVGIDWTTFSSTLLIESFAAAITASATQTQGQQTLTKILNEVGTVSTTNDVVTLPVIYKTGQICELKNNGSNTLQVFPSSGDSIDNGATDASITIAAGAGLSFWANGTQWISR